jgi:hypothetical protein
MRKNKRTNKSAPGRPLEVLTKRNSKREPGGASSGFKLQTKGINNRSSNQEDWQECTRRSARGLMQVDWQEA